jgi:hypothetical protein
MLTEESMKGVRKELNVATSRAGQRWAVSSASWCLRTGFIGDEYYFISSPCANREASAGFTWCIRAAIVAA